MLAAVFLTTCQTVFSEMPCPHGLPARQTHRNSGPLSIPAAVNHASSVSFTQFGTGTVRMCLPLPMRSTIAQRSSRRCNHSSVSSASSRRRRPQPSRMARIARLRFSGQSLSIGYLPERRRLARCKPVAQTRAQLADTFNAMDAGGQFRAQQSRVSRLVSQPSHGRHSHVDRPGRQAAILQVNPIPHHHGFVEGQAWFRTVPGDELIDRMLVSAPRVRRTEAPQDCCFRVLQIRYAELGFPRSQDSVFPVTAFAQILAKTFLLWQILVEETGKISRRSSALPRLGQGAFHVIVTDVYKRQCALANSPVMHVLAAAHFRPYAKGGSRSPTNGFLLWQDFHTLFDRTT